VGASLQACAQAAPPFNSTQAAPPTRLCFCTRAKNSMRSGGNPHALKQRPPRTQAASSIPCALSAHARSGSVCVSLKRLMPTRSSDTPHTRSVPPQQLAGMCKACDKGGLLLNPSPPAQRPPPLQSTCLLLGLLLPQLPQQLRHA